MPDQYTIYLVNESSGTQLFWCFLERPQELIGEDKVFANSSTNLAVGASQPGFNTFTIPIKYVVGAGAGTNPVALNTRINATVTNPANLQDVWQSKYATVPPNMGPTMEKTSDQGPANTITMGSNVFDKEQNEAHGWYSNMTFGIETSQGFMGMTWSPDSNKKRPIVPELKFYVTIGDYGSNTLARWTDIAKDTAEIIVPDSFSPFLNECTVTYTRVGTWKVTKGKPGVTALAASNFSSLIQSHWFLSKAHADLIDLVALPQPEQYYINESVKDENGTLAVNKSHSWNKNQYNQLDLDWSGPAGTTFSVSLKNPTSGSATKITAPGTRALTLNTDGKITNNSDKTIKYTLKKV